LQKEVEDKERLQNQYQETIQVGTWAFESAHDVVVVGCLAFGNSKTRIIESSTKFRRAIEIGCKVATRKIHYGQSN
jgi:hypothetical protein